MSSFDISELPRRLGVQVSPGKRRSAFKRYDKDSQVLYIDIGAVADKGKANAELVRFLKKEYGLTVKIISGDSSRKKIIELS